MFQNILESDQIKTLIKAVILEFFQENREMFTDILTELLEDIAIKRAISEAENSELVSRKEVFAILDF